MRVQPTRTYAILTGDVVGSSKLPASARRSLQRALGQVDTRVRRTFSKACPLPLDVFRGDAWQLLVVSAGTALRIALYVRALMRVLMDSRVVDTRVAIGIGKIQFIPGNEVSQGDGPAYRLSGQGLDEMPRQARLGVRSEDDDAPHVLLDALLIGTDALSRPWTVSQAQAIVGAITGKTQEAIATGWKPEPITQQAVAQHLDRAHWFAIERALAAFEAAHGENK